MNVLIVDDEENIREILSRTVSRQGFQAFSTADLVLTAGDKLDSRGRIIGIDLSFEMLKLAKLKTEASGNQTPIDLLRGDGMSLPLKDSYFDAAMIAFGIRNIPNTLQALNELRRVLKTNGKLAVLEFSLPKNKIIKIFYLLYFRYILPFIGKLFSGDSYAYSYLNKTAETYYQGKEFCSLLEEAGFKNISTKSLTFGIATIYRGDKK